MTTLERPGGGLPAGSTSAGVAPSVERSDRPLAWLLVVGGAVGLVAAFVLAVERVALLADDGYTPSCSLNPVLSCGSVMVTEQASVFGFPNPFLGIAAFPFVVATGAALLAGARLARWYWLGLQVGVTLGLVFVGWLVFQSVYRIGALCPYCMAVWGVVIPIALSVTLRNARAGVFGRSPRLLRGAEAASAWHLPLLVLAYLAVLVPVTVRFWYYWSTLFG